MAGHWTSGKPDRQLRCRAPVCFQMARIVQYAEEWPFSSAGAKLARQPADQFFGRWLTLREICDCGGAGPQRFPEYTDSLRESMYLVPLLFARTEESRTSSTRTSCTRTQESAAHYRLAGVRGPAIRRVSVSGNIWGGLLGMASLLTLISHPARTSPVSSGMDILQNLLSSHSPAPPPRAETIAETGGHAA